MKSNLLKLYVLSFIVLYTSCEENYIEPNSFSDASWYTSQFQSQPFRIGINDFISFSDVSINAQYHEWKIVKGTYFLNNNLIPLDFPYNKYISGQHSTSNDKTVHVLFQKPGNHKVTLYNEFLEQVPFSNKVGEKFILNKEFVVDVYDSIQANVAIYKNNIKIPISADTIFIKQGESLVFVDLTTVGRPNKRNWTIINGSVKLTSTDPEATITFNQEGIYQAYFTSLRIDNNLPFGSDDLAIQNPIKVSR